MAIIAVATSDGTNIDVHFGQAVFFQIYDVALDGTYKYLEKRNITQAQSDKGESNHAASTIEQLPDIDVVLVSRIGTGPSRTLEGRGIRAFAVPGSVDVALTAYGIYGTWDEQPEHEVCLSDFHLGTFEVTQKQWQAVMGNNPGKLLQQ